MESITPQDVPIAIEGDGVEFRKRPAGELSVSWVRLPKGANLAPLLEGLPGDRCHCPHWGYMISGRVRMHTDDGTHDYEAGEAFYWAPGHAPEALEDSEYVDFSPTEALDEVVEHVQAQAAAG
jgi:hypothetical protein